MNYVHKVIPNLSDSTQPLIEFLKKENSFRWKHEQKQAFKKLKKILICRPVLQFYKPNLPITFTVDVSQYALGAALIQESKPIGYSSKSLTLTQQTYDQIEKELLAIVFGCKNYHDFIFGENITVETDHKSSWNWLKEPLLECPMRLQRMLLDLQMYDINLVFKSELVHQI